MQPVDFTTLTALAVELRQMCLPARFEQAYQRDRTTLYLGLRTLTGRQWVLVSWHPQAARLCLSEPPPRDPDTFTFSQQLRHQLGGLALVELAAIAPWERVLDLRFAQRPGDPVRWHLYVEIMGKYSNVILVNADGQVVTAAHQVTAQQSSVRPILTGQPYTLPPRLLDAIPALAEPQADWQARLALIPGKLCRNLTRTYRGLSSALARQMALAADLDPDQTTDRLSDDDWQRLFARWQDWLQSLEKDHFQPGWTATGYTVMGWGLTDATDTAQQLVDRYYRLQLQQQYFTQLRHQLQQKVSQLLAKLETKQQGFRDRVQQAEQAEQWRQQADLLMAHLHTCAPGQTALTVPDFETGAPVTIPLDPTKTAVQNAQALYKKHQKLKRATAAIAPLLADVEAELTYLEHIAAELEDLTRCDTPNDWETLTEIRDELRQQGYMATPDYDKPQRKAATATSQPLTYQSPSGFEILVGRNNRQNDHLTTRLATDYDLWFHTQEIASSHVVLRVPPGAKPDAVDLQYTADVTAAHSRARQSEQVPVVYVAPRHVYKPKGAKPGTVIYTHETVIWGHPQHLKLP